MDTKNRLKTDFLYYDRESKQLAVAKRFKFYIEGKVLDVGADEGYLESSLPSSVQYTGIGLGGSNSNIVKIDLEKESMSFEHNSFDCVLCLDVLEHLDNLYEMLDELFSISRKYIIISLPNPWKGFLASFRKKYSPQQAIKFYGFPIKRPMDRHKWFFSPTEASNLISSKAMENNYSIVEYFMENSVESDPFLLRKILKKSIQATLNIFLRTDLSLDDLICGTSWWVLEKNGSHNNMKVTKERD